MTNARSIGEIIDALGQTRHEINALKQKETYLRNALMGLGPNGVLHGRNFTPHVRLGKRQTLLRDKLPNHILRDPQFWRVSETQTVFTRHKTSQNNGPPEHAEHEEIVLIEPL